MTRPEIRAHLWPDGTFVDFYSNISLAVGKLRDSLCDSAASPRYIETVERIGYRFIGQTECGSDEPPNSGLEQARERAAANLIGAANLSKHVSGSAGLRFMGSHDSTRVLILVVASIGIAIPQPNCCSNGQGCRQGNGSCVTSSSGPCR